VAAKIASNSPKLISNLFPTQTTRSARVESKYTDDLICQGGPIEQENSLGSAVVLGGEKENTYRTTDNETYQ